MENDSRVNGINIIRDLCYNMESDDDHDDDGGGGGG